MTQKQLNTILKKYFEGETSSEENTWVEQWFEQQKFPSVDITASEAKEMEKRIWNEIKIKSDLPEKKTLSFKYIFSTILAACLLIVAIFYFNKSSSIKENIENKLTHRITLPDGSEVVLHENAQIYYDKKFNLTHRNVTLMGSASFNVQSDKTKPFVITAGELTTEVTGTSFEIIQNTDLDIIEVKVTSGSVVVYSPSHKKQTKVTLQANEKVVYNKLYKNINQTITETPVPVIDTEAESLFVFNNTPLKEAIKIFEKVYGISFDITNKNIEDCLINADLNHLPMFTKLELICKSIDANYRIDGTTVQLDGDGCN